MKICTSSFQEVKALLVEQEKSSEDSPATTLASKINNTTCDIQIEIIDTDKNIYDVSCYNDKSTTHTKLGCCSITQKFPFDGLAYNINWGANCVKLENNLNDHIQIISFSEPSETTCRVKFTLLTTNGTKTESEFFYFNIITLKTSHVKIRLCMTDKCTNIMTFFAPYFQTMTI